MRVVLTALLVGAAVGCGRLSYAPQDGSTQADAFVAPNDSATPDAFALFDSATPDAFVSRDSPTADAACVAEACNGRDDDCDGRVDETFTRVASWGMCGTAPRMGPMTLATYTWDRRDTLQGAALVTGGVEFVGALNSPGVNALDAARTLGNLLAAPVVEPRYFALPFVGGNLALEPNIDRVSFEVSWGEGWAARDGAGDDFVVYEHGNPITEPEVFAVAVHDARTDTWSAPRWEFFDAFDGGDQLFVTAYDLADFGLVGGVVDRIRIESVFGFEAGEPDRASNATGDGFVIHVGDPLWTTANMLRLSDGGPGVATNLLDADLLWVSALNPLVEPTCCVF